MEAPSGAAKPLSCPIPILDLMVFKGVDMYIIVVCVINCVIVDCCVIRRVIIRCYSSMLQCIF